MKQLAALVLPPVILLGTTIALWGWMSAQGMIPNYLLPSPGKLAGALVGDRSVLLRHGLATTEEALSGYVIGSVLGLLAAVVLSFSRRLRACFFPLALATQAIPIIAVTPLIVLVMGRGMPAILTLVSITAFFPMLINMTRGLRVADRGYHELLHSLSASRLQRLAIVELPGAFPYLFAALRVAATACFINAIVGEWIGSNIGLGYLVVISGQYFKMPTLWAAIVVTAALTLILVGIVAVMERVMTPWAATEHGS
ncbi:ABC transporter permease [Acidisoma cellulosilytica]|uniref:ABC transporter permease n=1 Tax=Acidisoma cellulosilyticum TaxID=2802395 RepID=A0A963Z460_9PROT|nr:ABC transporter permease [Acidisoma cellulosilyticum]MCB8881592.1 ABC transporter permease [Acidisoma cellulosilyticum]